MRKEGVAEPTALYGHISFRTSCNNSIVGSIELLSERAVQARATASFELPLDILGPIVDKKGLDDHLQYTKSYCGLLKLA